MWSSLQLDSTELLSYPDGQAWTQGGKLVTPRERLSGASLAGVFHVLGRDGVFAWDPVARTWSKVGTMGEARKNHAIATIQDYCP